MHTGNNKEKNIQLATIWLYAIIVLIFVPHLVYYVFSMSLYIMILAAMCILLAFTRKKIRIEINRYTLMWYFAILVALVSLSFSNRSLGAILDVISLCCGMLLAVFYVQNINIYTKGIRLVYLFSLIFAFGILLQIVSPSIYRAVIEYFPSRFATAVLNGAQGRSSGIGGFTTNTGTAAAFLCTGIIAFLSLNSGDTNKSKMEKATRVFIFLFYLLMIMFTGKRGPSLFLILTILITYILQESGRKKIRKYATILLIILLIVLAFILFSPVLSMIPLIGGYINTISGILSGYDVSSMRLGLYLWAIKLFLQNPIFGIGWGEFRFTVVGNVTRVSSLDTHNIYLQLLSETGIIGFVIFMTLFIIFWIKTKEVFCNTLDEAIDGWKVLIHFSFMFQTYFLLYGLTGNPLYDQHYQILYALSCGILLCYMKYKKPSK